MNRKEEYRKLLEDPEWYKKRLKILSRDGFRCTSCFSKVNLQVHHLKYIKGKMPWEVPNNYLKTLCRACHEKAHEGKNISQFTKKKSIKKGKVKLTPDYKKKTSQRNLKKLEEMYRSLTPEELMLQKKRDEIFKD